LGEGRVLPYDCNYTYRRSIRNRDLLLGTHYSDNRTDKIQWWILKALGDYLRSNKLWLVLNHFPQDIN
jgi:hypothetical protein